MARGKLWSVKGVTGEAREAAKTAAKASGQPIGVWIDQAIRMSDEDGLPPERDPAANPGGNTDIDIVAVLEALEARVADHADRISEQLVPVRNSIAELANRLDAIEDSVSASGESPAPSPVPPAPAPPAAEPERDPESAPVPEPEPGNSGTDSEPSPPQLQPADMSGTHMPDDLATQTVHEEAPAQPESNSVPPSTAQQTPRNEAGEAAQPENISEEDIHATDAALKSELTGLFDDGIHRGTAQRRMGPADDPFLPPRPPRPTSRAPLIFVVVILLAVCAGIGAVAWFEFLSPEARRSLTSQFSSLTSQEAETADRTPAASAPEAATVSEPPAAPATPPASTPDEQPVSEPAEPALQAPEANTTATAAPTPQVTVPEPTIAPEAPAPPEATAETAPPPPPAPAPAPVAAPDPVRADATPAGETPVADANPELEALRREAAAGSASAQNDLGVRYLVGRGVAQDFSVAADWLRKAAAQDMTNAQYNLGVLYDSGRGVEPDPTEALIWFHTAAEKGHGRAQMAVAAAYASGRGIARNPDEALRWLRRAAESNIGEAQFSLANILATSPSSQESLIDAYVWYRIADANGNAQASQRAEQVAARLTPEERAGANARVSHFLGRNLPKPNLRPATPAAQTPARPAPPSPAPAPPVAAAAAPEPPEPAAVTNAEISEIQTLLTRLGFDPGIADGRAGQQTTEAIRNYQRELGLPVNGQPSEDLLRHLRQIAGVR